MGFPMRFTSVVARVGAVPSVMAIAWLCGPVASEAVAGGSEGKTKSPPINLFEKHAEEYVAEGKPVFVTVGPAKYLAIRGAGEPGGEEFRRKVGMIYGIAYALKSAQASRGRDFVIGALEGMWWAAGENVDFLDVPKSKWQWKLLIRVPKFVTEKDVTAFAGWGGRQGAKGQSQAIELETLNEGKCVQVLHVGPYSAENATIAAMRAFAKKNGLTENGVHHEIYLSDPNKTPPEKLRTILRQPVK